MDRIDPSVFNLPVHELRRGYRSAVYFWRAKKILEAEMPDQNVLMQVFQKGNSILCGVDEAIAILKVATGHWENQHKADKLFDDYLNEKLNLGRYQLEDTQAYQATLIRMADIE